MNDKLKSLGEREIKLICKEMAITKEALFELDEDGLMEVYDVILDVEMEEEMKSPTKMSEKGMLAANILSVLEDQILKCVNSVDSLIFKDVYGIILQVNLPFYRARYKK